LIQDVRLALEDARPVGFYGRQGGIVPTASEIYEVLRGTREEDRVHHLAS
jgi:hypothetical protein